MQKKYIKYVQDRGNVEFETRISSHEGDVFSIATRDVVSVPPTMTIMGAAKTMMKYRFRRLPVTDAGTSRLLGIVTCVDIIDFLGGGDLYRLVEEKYRGNLVAAVNEEVREIMKKEVVSLHEDGTLKEALDLMISKNISALPITNSEGIIRGIVTERDFVWYAAGKVKGKTVEEYMTKKIISAPPTISIKNASEILINNKIRRLPIVTDDVLIGMITSTDIVRFLASGEVFEKLITGDISEAFTSPIKMLMVKELATTSPEVDLGDAAEVMMEKNVGSLPVIKDGSLVGILTEKDFLNALDEIE
ncbi:MAG: CBS domain-containing protein [Candidatus Syntropharchaeia archaeon]